MKIKKLATILLAAIGTAVLVLGLENYINGLSQAPHPPTGEEDMEDL